MLLAKTKIMYLCSPKRDDVTEIKNFKIAVLLKTYNNVRQQC